MRFSSLRVIVTDEFGKQLFSRVIFLRNRKDTTRFSPNFFLFSDLSERQKIAERLCYFMYLAMFSHRVSTKKSAEAKWRFFLKDQSLKVHHLNYMIYYLPLYGELQRKWENDREQWKKDLVSDLLEILNKIYATQFADACVPVCTVV